MTDTKGNGIMKYTFVGYESDEGELITLFIILGTEIYVGMVVGENSRSDDELVEIKPENIRFIKKILDSTLRFRNSKK